MTSSSRTVRSSDPVMLGGLALVPLCLVFLLTAIAFQQGWLEWESQGGPPFLGVAGATFLYEVVYRKYYRQVPNFLLGWDSREEPPTDARTERWTRLAGILFLGAVLAAWYADARGWGPVRFGTLVLATMFVTLGRNSSHRALGYVYWGTSLIFVLFSVLPWLLHAPVRNPYFGVEGIGELMLVSGVGFVIAVVEHRVIVTTLLPLAPPSHSP